MLGGKGDDSGWEGCMAAPTRWTWVWVNSGWWTGRPGVLQFMGSQRVGHDWATELNLWMSYVVVASLERIHQREMFLRSKLSEDAFSSFVFEWQFTCVLNSRVKVIFPQNFEGLTQVSAGSCYKGRPETVVIPTPWWDLFIPSVPWGSFWGVHLGPSALQNFPVFSMSSDFFILAFLNACYSYVRSSEFSVNFLSPTFF